jgi:hypothetical protein
MTGEEKQVPLWKSTTLVHEDTSHEFGKKILRAQPARARVLKTSIRNDR